MDLRVILSTFGAVFLAELGDKTQLATFTLAAGSSARWSVFVGSAAALATSSLVAVTVADQVGKYVSGRWLQGAAGILLLGVGAFYVVGALRK